MNEDDAKGALSGLDVSRETLERLEHLARLVRQWSPKINLVAPATLDAVWSRHILDSAQIARFGPLEASSWVDLGSGGGFPGLVIAAMRSALDPTLQTTLIEADRRKAVFLSTAAQRMDLKVAIEVRRIEQEPRPRFAVASARALAPLDRLLDLAVPWLAEGGKLLLPKGARAQAELTSAAKRWHMDVVAHPSLTDPSATILEVRKATRRDEPDGRFPPR